MEIELSSELKVGSVPDYNGKKYGKLQITSQKLAVLVGKKVRVKLIVEFNAKELFEVEM